jgi:hypothetical protein
MSDEGGSRKVRKTGSPKVRKKPEVGSPKSEGESQNSKVKNQNSKEHSAFDISQSELKNKSERRSPLEHLEKNKQKRKN